MKTKIFQILSSILLITILSINSVYAQIGPGTPHQFFGTVTFSNGPASDGLSVVAKIEEGEVASTTTSNGKYGYSPLIFYIEDPDNDRYNKTIYFFVNGAQANENAVFYNGNSTRLDLTLDVPGPVTTTTVPTRGPTRGGRGAAAATTTSTTTTSTTSTTLKPTEKVNMDIENLIIPSDIVVGESFELGIVVKNIGDEEGTDDITISLPEGWTTDKWGERITLDADESKIIYFTITPSGNSGQIAAGSSTDFEVSGTLTPREKERVMSITGMFLTALASLGYWWILIIIIVVLLIVVLARRKASGKKPYRYKHKPRLRKMMI